MICELADEERVECILPLRLTGTALAVYRQLSKEQRADIDEIKRAFTTAFTVNAFVVFEQFATRRLRDRETVDEFLTTLERLAHQVRERPPEKWIAYAFIAGLPHHVRQQLRASARMDTLTLDQLCARARAILVEDHRPINQIVAVAQRPQADAVEVIANQNGRNSVCCPCPNPTYLDNGSTHPLMIKLGYCHEIWNWYFVSVVGAAEKYFKSLWILAFYRLAQEIAGHRPKDSDGRREKLFQEIICTCIFF